MEILRDREEIEAYLRADTQLHLYELGDLDDFFWPRTTWYGLRERGRLACLALLYSGAGLPVLLALAGPGSGSYEQLLPGLAPKLPEEFYCHLSPGLEQLLERSFKLEDHGLHLKMALDDRHRLEQADIGEAARLAPGDLGELTRFYSECYPGNWFDPRMLETGQYFGIRRGGRLASAAGVHVYSPAYRVAALGNIATDPAWRGRGLGTAVTAALCRSLLGTVDDIGLNVKADNGPAIRCYENIGFKTCGEYREATVNRPRSQCP